MRILQSAYEQLPYPTYMKYAIITFTSYIELCIFALYLSREDDKISAAH